MLLHIVTYCTILLHIVAYCYMLSHIVTYGTWFITYCDILYILLHVVTYCNILYHIETYCTILYILLHIVQIVTCCYILSHIVTYCNTLSHITTYSHILSHVVTYGHILYDIVTYCYILLHIVHIVTCCYILPHIVSYCNILIHIVHIVSYYTYCTYCYILLHVVTYCYMLLHIVTYCTQSDFEAPVLQMRQSCWPSWEPGSPRVQTWPTRGHLKSKSSQHIPMTSFIHLSICFLDFLSTSFDLYIFCHVFRCCYIECHDVSRWLLPSPSIYFNAEGMREWCERNALMRQRSGLWESADLLEGCVAQPTPDMTSFTSCDKSN